MYYVTAYQCYQEVWYDYRETFPFLLSEYVLWKESIVTKKKSDCGTLA